MVLQQGCRSWSNYGNNTQTIIERVSQWSIESFCQPHASIETIPQIAQFTINKFNIQLFGKNCKIQNRLAKTPIINLRLSGVLGHSMCSWSDQKPKI